MSAIYSVRTLQMEQSKLGLGLGLGVICFQPPNPSPLTSPLPAPPHPNPHPPANYLSCIPTEPVPGKAEAAPAGLCGSLKYFLRHMGHRTIFQPQSWRKRVWMRQDCYHNQISQLRPKADQGTT